MFAQTAILQFLVAAFISLVVHLAVKIANNPTLGIVFVCALMGVTMVPGYYGRSIALREFALLNPLTYANTELTVGAYSPYPTTQIVNLPGLCFERGAIALVCAIGIEVLAISLLCVAGKSGCACPISPICLERGSFTASRTATRSSACASAVAYVRTMGKLLLRSPTLAVCAIAMSTTMLAPALVEMFPDADNVSAVRYRDGELRSIDRYLEQNAANMDVEGKAALEDMRDALSGFVYAPMPAEGFRSLATYERARGELGAADATLLQSIGIEPETPSRAEARALLLESIASLPDPKVYELSTKMPPLILLSYLQAALPSLFLLLPVVVTSLACTHLQCRSLLVLQIPATAHVRFLTAVALALLLGLVLLLVSMVPAVVVSVIKNGAGGSEYPVALIRAGASTTSMVGEAVLCSIPLLVMAYGVISVVAALTAAISRNPVVTGMVCAVLLVLGSLSAHVESVGMGVALLAPFASFDPASQVGTIGFLGRRISVDGAPECSKDRKGMISMIDLQTLTISYGKKVLVDSVNAEFAPGTVYGLVAPNGHGKTTLLRAMAGLPGPRVDGSIVLDEVQGTGAREVRSMIFYAPGEGTLLYPGLRAEDHLKMVCDMWPHARDIEEIVEQTQIGEFAKMRIRTLSQGMKQQLTLAIAYATGARYLLLDEPMNALDPSRVDLHSEILRKLADSGTCIIMSSHILDSVDRLCDEILFLKDGRLIRSIPQDDAAPKSPGSHFAKPAGRAEGALSTYRRLYEKGG